jgi:hypothetical protein
MAEWKQLLVVGDAATDNLGSADLTQTSSVRTYTVGSSKRLILSGGAVQFSDGSSVSHQFDNASGVFDARSANGIRLSDGDNDYHIDLKPKSELTGSYVITLPNGSPGGANKILESDANGNLTWIDTPSGSVGATGATGPQGATGPTGATGADGSDATISIDNYADTRLLTAGSSSSNIDAESSLTFDGYTLDVIGHIEYTADANNRCGEIWDAEDSGRYATNASVSAGDMHRWPKTGSVTAFKIYTLNGTTQVPELLDASGSSTNINQIAGLCPITSSTGNKFYVRCMATIPASSVNGTFSSGDAGDPVYLDPSNTGVLTLTEPTSGAYVRHMGYVLSQTTISSTTYYVIWFDPSPNYIRV